MDKIATIIVHYNTKTDTDNTLESLSKIKSGPFEHQIFVVDNGSKEAYELPKKTPAQTTLISSAKNLGFTGGNNLGFKRAQENFDPDFYLLLNSDTLVQPDFLNHLYQELKNNPRLGIVSPLIYFAPGCEFHAQSYSKAEKGQVIWFAGGIFDWPNLSTFHLGVDEINRDQFSLYPPKFDFATGCCFLMRREIYETVGGFDDRYFLYYEDADLSARVTKAGYQLGLCSQSQIWHLNGGSGGGVGSDLQCYYMNRNRLLFNWLHGHWRSKITTLRLALQLLMSENRIEQIAARHFFICHFGKQVYI